MDDKIKRNISEDTLKAVLAKLNDDFIKELPAPPEELLKYAKRRVEPYISESISFALGKAMLESRMTDEEYLLAFFQAIHTSFEGVEKENSPEASILISQTGAGKTNLRRIILQKRKNSVIINPDLYKKFNPRFREFMETDPTHIGALTGIDSYDHASNLKDFAIENGYDLLFECAPAEDHLIGVDVEELERHGYDIQYYALAVGNLVSLLSIHARYEEDLQSGKVEGAKLTDFNRHNESYRGVVKVLEGLRPEKVHIYRRGTKEEEYVPQEVNSDSDTTIMQKVERLNSERERSSRLYVFGAQGAIDGQISSGTEANFQLDYNRIRESMIRRNAPQPQLDQLASVYSQYVEYLNHIKYTDTTIGFSFDDE